MTKAGRKKTERLPEKVLQELAAIGLTRATDVLTVENGQVELKTPREMGTSHGAAIAAVEKTAGGWKIKLYDKLKALELLGSYLGLSGSGGGEREGDADHLLDAILEATKGDMDLSEIHELQQTAASGDDLVESSGAGGS